MRRMGIPKDEMSRHGFRAMARTILDEVLEVRPDLIEHQLAHAVSRMEGLRIWPRLWSFVRFARSKADSKIKYLQWAAQAAFLHFKPGVHMVSTLVDAGV